MDRVGQNCISIIIRRIIQGGGGRIYVPYFPYQKPIGIIRRIYAVFPYYSTVQNPGLRFNSQQEQSFLLFEINFFPFMTLLIKHSLCFPLSLNARFCINHNVLLFYWWLE
jgi:hypothetical protein